MNRFVFTYIVVYWDYEDNKRYKESGAVIAETINGAIALVLEYYDGTECDSIEVRANVESEIPEDGNKIVDLFQEVVH